MRQHSSRYIELQQLAEILSRPYARSGVPSRACCCRRRPRPVWHRLFFLSARMAAADLRRAGSDDENDRRLARRSRKDRGRQFRSAVSRAGVVTVIRNACQTCLFLIVLMTPSAGVAPPPAQQEPATLVMTNGRILTVEDSLPEVQAVAVRGDRIVALGSAADIRRYIGTSTEVIDVQG